MLTVRLYVVHPADRFLRRPVALCVGSVTYAADIRPGCSCARCQAPETPSEFR